MRMNAQIDIRHVLPSIRVPTLIVHRSGDLLLPVEMGRYMAERIPGATYVELPGPDHLPFVGDQDAILDEIERFVTKVQPTTAPESSRATNRHSVGCERSKWPQSGASRSRVASPVAIPSL